MDAACKSSRQSPVKRHSQNHSARSNSFLISESSSIQFIFDIRSCADSCGRVPQVVIHRGEAEREGEAGDADGGENGGAPFLSYSQIFARFLSLGCVAVGGSHNHANIMKDALMKQDSWSTPTDFDRLIALSSLLPGPFCFSLSCHLGALSNGKSGGIVAAVAFILPGLLVVSPSPKPQIPIRKPKP